MCGARPATPAQGGAPDPSLACLHRKGGKNSTGQGEGAMLADQELTAKGIERWSRCCRLLEKARPRQRAGGSDPMVLKDSPAQIEGNGDGHAPAAAEKSRAQTEPGYGS